MDIKKICCGCQKDFSVVGEAYKRGNGRIDYYCSKKKGGCGSKLAPMDCFEETVYDQVVMAEWVGKRGAKTILKEQFPMITECIDGIINNGEEIVNLNTTRSPLKDLDFKPTIKDPYELTGLDKAYDEQDTVNMTGSTEYAPEHKLTETGYKVYYKNTYVVATHEELRKAFMMYCVGGLTMNQVALEMIWTREEFNAIKTAFHITKDAAPFTPFEIDQMSPDEMAEIVRIEKKRYALTKLAHSSNNDIRKEIDRHHKADYFLDKVIEGVNALDVTQYKVPNAWRDSKYTYVVKITDEHAGLEVESVHNEYNIDVMKSRFNDVYDHIVNNIPVGDVTILSGGDLVHGLIHGSTEKASTYVMTALIEVIGCYTKLIKSLIEFGYSVKFAKANGSHSSLEKNKMNRTEEENLGRMLPFHLVALFANTEAFELLKPLTGTNHTLIPIGVDKHAILGHGDEMKNVKSYAAFANSLNRNVTEFLLGHIHHYKAEELDGVLVEHTMSFCGSDQYASKLGLIGDCGFTVFKYDELGDRVGIENVKF
jgi:hypothetical protein